MRRFLYVLPVVIFTVLALFFLKGLTLNPRDIPSVLIDRPVPEMSLAPPAGAGREFRPVHQGPQGPGVAGQHLWLLVHFLRAGAPHPDGDQEAR